MKRLITALAGVIVVAACGTAEPLGTTLGSSASSSTTISSAPTTTTTSTTTTTVPPTTTTTLLEGNWAEQPVIASDPWLGVLGWWDGTSWVQSLNDMSLPVSGGEDYQIALLGKENLSTQGGPRVTACDIHGPGVDAPGIEFADPDLLTRSVESDPSRGSISGVAISAPWDLTPYHLGPGEAHPDLEAMGVSLLSDRGFATDSPEIVQTVDVDLEGEGFIETIVVVEATELGNSISGVYSLVFLVTEDATPIVIEESVIPTDQEGFPASFRVGAVADLNGDGSMEVILDGLAWENEWVTVYELVGNEFVKRIGAGCGV